MADIKWKYRKVKNGVRFFGEVTLPCGDTIKDSGVARTEELGRKAVERLIVSLAQAHVKECKKTK